jgi:glutamate synthase (NADPH/NADH) small chain
VGACVYNLEDVPPIQIGRLQRYATEELQATGRKLLAPKPAIGRRVALVGGGPASLACAAYLALEGVETEVLEKMPFAGGLNASGIAPYKMTAEESQREVELVRGLGVTIRNGVDVDPALAARLLAEYDAVFLGPGLGGDRRMHVEGEEGPGIFGATEWIARMKLDPGASLAGIGKVVVVGGGNTALDAVQELAKLGVASVTLVYRRSEAEMPGYAHEREGARHDGVRFLFEHVPVRVARHDGTLTGLAVARAVKGTPVEGTVDFVPADLVLVAIGQSRLPALVAAFPGVALENGRVVADPGTLRTGNPKVWAGGDAVNGGKEVVNAVQHGKLAAQAMLRSFGRDVTLVPRPLTAAPYETTSSVSH